MAFKQFPNKQYFRVLDTDTVTNVGYFNLDDGTEITSMMITLFVRGLIVTPFNIRLNLYGSSTSVTPIVSSDWATLSAATLLNNDTDPGVAYTRNWFGNIFLDFGGNPLNPNLNYYMSVQTSGYTRILYTFYVGVNLDWYSPVNNQLNGPTLAGARIRPIGMRQLAT